MRASRLLSVLLLLQARGRMTAQQLADELDVSVRTVYRDVESLSAAGVPLYGESGHQGGYRLVDGYRTRLTGLTGGEAEALLLVGAPGPASDLGLGETLATARRKVMAALPVELRDRASRLTDWFHFDTSGWYTNADPKPPPHLAEVLDATWRQRRIRMTHQRWSTKEVTTRTLAPYGVVHKAGRWFLIAEGHGEIRGYLMSQIRQLQVLDEGFTRPEGFDLVEQWRSWLGTFERPAQDEAIVRLSPEILRELSTMLRPAITLATVISEQPPDPDGWVQVRIPIISHELAAAALLGLGANAEVLAPSTLRKQVAEAVVALAETYHTDQD